MFCLMSFPPLLAKAVDQLIHLVEINTSRILVAYLFENWSKMLAEGLRDSVDRLIIKMGNAQEQSLYYRSLKVTSYIENSLIDYHERLSEDIEAPKKSYFYIAIIAIKDVADIAIRLVQYFIDDARYSLKVFEQAVKLCRAINTNDLSSDLLLEQALASGAAYYRLNKNGTVSYWHPSSAELFGFTSENIRNKLPVSTFISNDQSGHLKHCLVCNNPDFYPLSLNINQDSQEEKFWALSFNRLNDRAEVSSIVWKISSPWIISLLINLIDYWSSIKLKEILFKPLNNLTQKIKDIYFKLEIKKAISCNHLEVYYQPQIDTNNNKTIAFEALVRWHHPEKGILSPNLFIHFAETNELIEKIDFWVLNEACKKIKQCQSIFQDRIKIAINISGKTFADDNLIKKVGKILTQNDISPKLIELEITETWFPQDISTVIRNLRSLKKLGISTSLDDFGTGSTGWEFLSKQSFDTVKIDKMYISNLKDADKMTVLKSMVNMAKKLDFHLIVEGIETEEQLQLVKELKVDSCQGFLFSRPLAPDDFTKYLIRIVEKEA